MEAEVPLASQFPACIFTPLERAATVAPEPRTISCPALAVAAAPGASMTAPELKSTPEPRIETIEFSASAVPVTVASLLHSGRMRIRLLAPRVTRPVL